MGQLSTVLGDSGAVELLENEVENLENELRVAQRRTSELTDGDSPDSSHSLIEALNTLKILKTQYRGVEEYLRNSAKFEKDEVRSQIRRLQKKSTSLLREIRSVKENANALQRPDPGIQGLAELITTIQSEINTKEQKITAVQAESERDVSKLEELTRHSQAIEAEIKRCRALLFMELNHLQSESSVI
jgi:chromosome segregation ATPase